MEERPLLSRFGKLPTYLWRAMKEAHAVIYAVIASVTFFVLNLLGPSMLPHFPAVGLSIAVCGSVIIALVILGIGGYLVWEEENNQHSTLKGHHAALQERLKPRLRIEFDPQDDRFVCETRTNEYRQIVYIRVLARPLSPVVKNCRGFLKGISQVTKDGEKYISLFDDHVPLPWSYENPRAIAPKELNQSVDSFLDVAWVVEDDPHFGLLNAASEAPNQLSDVVQFLVLPKPSRNIKLDLLLIGDDSESAALSLNIHLGNPQWNKPQVGWMTDQTGNAIHHLQGNA